MNNFRIELKDLRFVARIGVSEQERKVENEFAVDVAYSFPSSGFTSEDLSTTISYADIYDIARREMSKEWLLLESVASSISDIIHVRFPTIGELEVSVTKMSVPLDSIDGVAKVTLKSSGS